MWYWITWYYDNDVRLIYFCDLNWTTTLSFTKYIREKGAIWLQHLFRRASLYHSIVCLRFHNFFVNNFNTLEASKPETSFSNELEGFYMMCADEAYLALSAPIVIDITNYQTSSAW